MCVVQRGLKVSNHTGKLCVSWGLAVGSVGTGMENSVYCQLFFWHCYCTSVTMNLLWLRALFCFVCMHSMQFPQDLGFGQNTVFQKLAPVFQNCLVLVCVITYFHMEHRTFANGSCL